MSGFFAAGRYWDLGPDQAAALAQARADLAAAGVADPLRDLHLLWAHCGGDPAAFAALSARRAARVPMAQLLGYRDFYKHRFIVTADVLDPRPETEQLVTAALAAPFAHVLDLGTGSGAILLSLLAERPAASGLGVDLSARALAVARRNATALGLGARAQFAQSDWFAQVSGQFDLIVANPPYIAAAEMAALAPEVRDHEPHLALTDQADGLACYRRIVAGAGAHLAPGGRLMLEIGPSQGAALHGLLAQAGFAALQVLPDLDGRDRVVAGVWPTGAVAPPPQ